MDKDLRNTALYLQAEALYRTLRKPGTGQIRDAGEISASPDGAYAVFSGTIVDALEGAPPTRICLTELATGDTRVLTYGPNTDRLPKYSSDGRHVAFLSDRHKAGDFQLHLLDPTTGVARPAPRVAGWVEYFHWSPDSRRILLGVAGHGADVSGGQGAITSKQVAEDLPSWMPAVEQGDEDFRWRSACVYDLSSDSLRKIALANTNIWEATWCGDSAIAAVSSPSPGEGHWYSAELHVVEISSGRCEKLYQPRDQLGWPSASPSGRHLAVVEAICSDRWVVAGDLRLIDTQTKSVRLVDTRGVDITHTEWRSENRLLLAGHRGFESVIALYDVATGVLREVWSSADITTGSRYITVSGCNETGECVLVGEGFCCAPEIAAIRGGEYRKVKSFDTGYAEVTNAIHAMDRLTWNAPDGLDIQGWLLRPVGRGPHPLVVNIHGGPVSHWRPTWLGRRSVHLLQLLQRGYAILLPNPRGSSGRGQSFARHVLGDMGGADTQDHLSGLDYLVQQGFADPARLGVTGASYGGFMTSWLITQDPRFAAAVPVAPMTNSVTEHLISNIPHFVKLFLADNYTNPTGKYFQRSPIMHAHKVRTPTLNICGALDRCTPPEEAVQFHNALRENRVRSVLITYPEEGHGVRKLPAGIDYAARIVAWFEEHMPAARGVSHL